MTAQIQELIDKVDTFEIVQALIFTILKEETESQQALAVLADKDPALWKLRVYADRVNPWEQFLNDAPDNRVDDSPIVNILFDQESTEEKRSNTSVRQQVTGVYTIDIYGFGRAENNTEGGHLPGDVAANAKSKLGIRLVRNILMSGYYNKLGVDQPQTLIGDRMIRSIVQFQPVKQDGQPIQRLVANRISLEVSFNEYAPEYQGEMLEELGITVDNESGDEILSALYRY
jgi:hypothetical protein